MTRLQTAILCAFTVLSLLFSWACVKTHDPEGILLCSFLGVIGTAFTAPFWLLYRGRFPYFLIVLFVFAWVFGSFAIGDMALRRTGEPSDPVWAWVYVPGLVIASVKAYKERRG